MAHSLSAQKRIRQNEKARARNRWRKRTLKESLKAMEEALAHGSQVDAEKAFRAACRTLDRTAQKGVIHRNTAARKKSRLNAALRAKMKS